MRTDEIIINVIFDAAKGRLSVTSREAVSGKPFGTLPQPTRAGYAFEGWYLDGELVTESTVLTAEDDVRLIAHWSKQRAVERKKSQLARQRVAAVILCVVALALVLSFITVNFVQDYSIVDVYFDESGEKHQVKYYVKKRNGEFGLYYKNGTMVDRNSDGYYIVDGGNQYEVDPESGTAELYAAVDFVIEGDETELYKRVLIFPQIKQKNVRSISVKNEHGEYRFYTDDKGIVKIEGFEETAVEYNPELYASLCVSCGYTLAMKKLDMTSEEIRRLPDGSVDYSAFGLAAENDPTDYTITGVSGDNGAEVSYTVKVGDAILSGAGYYVQLEGRETVYVLSSSLGETVQQPIESLVTPRVIYQSTMANHLMVGDFTLGTIPGNVFAQDNEMSIDEKNVIVAFTYQDMEQRDGTMLSYRPYISQHELMRGYELHGNNVSSMLGNLYELQYLSCKKLGITKEALAEYNLDKDVFYMSYLSRVDTNVETGEVTYVENFVLVSQKTPQGTYYMASLDYDMIVEVDQYYLSFLEWELNDWYDPQFYPHDISYLQEMHITIGGKNFDFRLDNSLSYAYYIKNGKASFPDFTKGTLTLDAEGNYVYYDQNGKKVDFKVIDFENGTFSTADDGDAVYLDGNVEVNLKVISTNLLVYCDQYNRGVMVVDLLDYKHTYSYVNDAGDTVTKTYTGNQNFRAFYMDMLYFNIVGDFDEAEFQANMGMSSAEYIAQGEDVCDAIISYRVEDLAKYTNQYTYKDKTGATVKLYPENNVQEVVLRFYQYTEMKTLLTVEVVEKYDENGNPILNPSAAVGVFYVWDYYLDTLEQDLDRILSEERVED